MNTTQTSNPNLITKEKLLTLVGEFLWSFSNEFFIITEVGSFIWKDPNYPGGDNTIAPYAQDFNAWLKERNLPYARDKGKHVIGHYCGSDFSLI